MDVQHVLGRRYVNGHAEPGSSFILANGKGGFLNISSEPLSKFNGLFVNYMGKVFRVIEHISIVNAAIPSGLVNRFYCFERRRPGLAERFFMPKGINSVVYETSAKIFADIFFDIRRAYDLRSWGRNYVVELQPGMAVVAFTKSTHFLEDLSHGAREYSLFVAVRHDGSAEALDEWVYRSYPSDEARSSYPSSRHVYRGLRLSCRKAVFSVSCDKSAAIAEANAVFSKAARFKSLEVRSFARFRSNDLAYSCASASLYRLLTADGILAGYPWFFQVWSRDEAISSRALSLLGFGKESKSILLRQLAALKADGRTPNIFSAAYSSGDGPAPVACADGVGWVFLRLGGLARMLTPAEQKDAAAKLEGCIASLRQNYEKSGLIYSGQLETWMDTAVADDTRQGFRIEIQALQLAMYRLALRLTGKKEYESLENQLAEKVRSGFWNDRILADGLGDFTARPNAFIAAYVYPELLSKAEWGVCFENLLKELWLPWGGIATISRSSPLFRSRYSGEPPYSYHRGDSWFWINNLAAIVMHRVDRRKFRPYIQSIFQASRKDILWKGAVGCHSELSSAEAQRAEGSLSQAWSAAMFIELCHELGRC